MGEEKEHRITASEVLFQNVYQISEDMISATYKVVEELAKFETVFDNMTNRLGDLNNNLELHIMKHKWVKGLDKKKVKSRIDQTKELARICSEYSIACKETANQLIIITEKFESNKKVKDIIKNLVERLQGEAKKIKDIPPPADDEEHNEDEEG